LRSSVKIGINTEKISNGCPHTSKKWPDFTPLKAGLVTLLWGHLLKLK
jgi:hypothetical protein